MTNMVLIRTLPRTAAFSFRLHQRPNDGGEQNGLGVWGQGGVLEMPTRWRISSRSD
jgi:hypothetical protein